MNRALRKHAKALRDDEKAYFKEKAEKNMQIPLLPETLADNLKADSVVFKKKQIKKEDKVVSERDKLK